MPKSKICCNGAHLHVYIIVTMEWDYVSVEMQLLMGPLSIPQMIHE
jgi:hypothetical protein